MFSRHACFGFWSLLKKTSHALTGYPWSFLAGSYIHIRCWSPPPPHCGTEEYGLQNQGCIRYHHRHGSYPHYHTGKHFRPAFSNYKRIENSSKLCFRFQESYVQIITRPEALSGVHQLQYSGVYGNALVFIVLFWIWGPLIRWLNH